MILEKRPFMVGRKRKNVDLKKYLSNRSLNKVLLKDIDKVKYLIFKNKLLLQELKAFIVKLLVAAI